VAVAVAEGAAASGFVVDASIAEVAASIPIALVDGAGALAVADAVVAAALGGALVVGVEVCEAAGAVSAPKILSRK
jgi:hypothetical protein